jgi:hypothetical protein
VKTQEEDIHTEHGSSRTNSLHPARNINLTLPQGIYYFVTGSADPYNAGWRNSSEMPTVTLALV